MAKKNHSTAQACPVSSCWRNCSDSWRGSFSRNEPSWHRQRPAVSTSALDSNAARASRRVLRGAMIVFHHENIPETRVPALRGRSHPHDNPKKRPDTDRDLIWEWRRCPAFGRMNPGLAPAAMAKRSPPCGPPSGKRRRADTARQFGAGADVARSARGRPRAMRGCPRYRWFIGVYDRSDLPTYFCVGRKMRFPIRCSSQWASQPATREMAKMGVKHSAGMPSS